MEQKEVDKIEVGEWIRTHTGEIGKVFKVELAKEEREKYPNNPYKGYWRDKYVTDVRRGYCTRQVIKKHSKNIIDLIEVGDYVNGHKVKQINCKLEYIDDDSDTGVNEVDNGLEIEGYPTWIYFECEIESIVTKEQFASMEYRLEV